MNIRCRCAMILMAALVCGSMTVPVCAAEVAAKTTEITAEERNYEIRVNRALNFTVVYTEDAAGEFTVPVIEFANSTGRNNKTPVGTYKVKKKHRWQPMFGGVYTQYAVRYQTHIMFHSAYYTKRNNNSTLSWTEYNKLGQQASAGCVREATIDSKWLYDNCKIGTTVVVYDDPNEQPPFAMPRTVKIPEDSPYRGWDPTDPDPKNPWQELRPVLTLTSNWGDGKTISLSSGASLAELQAQIGLLTPEGVAYVPEGYALEIYGVYDLNTPGVYEIYVRGFDLATTLRADATYTLNITSRN